MAGQCRQANVVYGATVKTSPFLPHIRLFSILTKRSESYPLPPSFNLDNFLFLENINSTHLGWLSEDDLYAAIQFSIDSRSKKLWYLRILDIQNNLVFSILPGASPYFTFCWKWLQQSVQTVLVISQSLSCLPLKYRGGHQEGITPTKTQTKSFKKALLFILYPKMDFYHVLGSFLYFDFAPSLPPSALVQN